MDLYLYIVWTAVFLPLFYYFDFWKKCGEKRLLFFSNHSFCGLSTPLGEYLLIYSVAGLLLAVALELGINFGLDEPVSKLALPLVADVDNPPPPFVMQILYGFVLAYSLRILLSTKALPFWSGTFDTLLESIFHQQLDNRIAHVRLEGKRNFIDALVAKYERKANPKKGTTTVTLTKETFGANLADYLDEIGELEKNIEEYNALLLDVKSSKDVTTAISSVMSSIKTLTRSQVKYIAFIEFRRHGQKEQQPGINRPVAIGIACLMIVSVAALYFVTEWKARADDTKANRVARLADVEQNYFVDFREDIPSTNNTLTDFYIHSNRPLVDTLNTLAGSYRSGAKSRGIIYISGAPGDGKSTFLTYLRSGVLNGINEAFSVGQMLKNRSLHFKSTADLRVMLDNEEIVLSHLPQMTDRNLTADSLLSLMGKRINEGFILIDDIDMMSDSTANYVIGTFEKWASESTDKFLYVIFCGRPEVFHAHLDTVQYAKNLSYIRHEMPELKFRSRNDLYVKVREYSDYRKKGWKEERLQKITDNLYQLVTQNQFLSYTLQNLELSNKVIGFAENQGSFKTDEIKQTLFDGLAKSAHSRHNRPMTPLYRNMLRAIASEYIDVKEGGYFQVSDKTLSILEKGKQVSFNVKDVLNRSGLVTVQVDNMYDMYRFTPFWVHQYLAESDTAR